MIKYSLSVFFFLLCISGFSQGEADSFHLKEENHEELQKRSFEQELTDRYQGDEFNYDTKSGEAQNLIQRFLRWFFQTLRDTFGIDIPPGALEVIEYLIYILMGVLVLYLLIRFFVGENPSSIFTKNAGGLADLNLTELHIENIDLDALIKSAFEQKDYRLAIRYHYLKVLKILSQKNMIRWQYEKTNLDYQNEISTPSVKSIFKEVSYLYDYIWYGEQPIDETKYRTAEARFTTLKDQILT